VQLAIRGRWTIVKSGGPRTPELVERLAGLPDAVLENLMRRPWPNGWGDARAAGVTASGGV